MAQQTVMGCTVYRNIVSIISGVNSIILSFWLIGVRAGHWYKIYRYTCESAMILNPETELNRT
jgi:hypothetical protein